MHTNYMCMCALCELSPSLCSLVQAEYWQDPFDETKYVQDCTFLPDINQEKVSIGGGMDAM